MALRKGEVAPSGETPMTTRLPGAETGESASTVLWLELAEGAMREALVERLAQAHMSGVLRKDPIGAPPETSRES